MDDPSELHDQDLNWSELEKVPVFKRTRKARAEVFNLDTRAGVAKVLHQVVKDEEEKTENRLNALKQLRELNGIDGVRLDNLQSASNENVLSLIKSFIEPVAEWLGGEVDYEGVEGA